MSWLFSRALVEEYSAANSLAGEPSVQLNGNPIPQAYCAPDRMTKFSRLSRFGMTYAPSTASRGEELLTLYLAGFPAKTSVPQGGGLESSAVDQDSGLKWQGLLGKYDHATRSWKTAQCSLLEDLEQCLEIWPRWGLMRDGVSYQQQTLVRHTSENESGSWHTPIFPTPTTGGGGGERSAKRAGTGNLDFMARTNKWPTPRAFMHKDSTKDRGKHNLGEVVGGSLNPNWVEWLMNWPIKWSNLNGFDKQEFQRWQEASAEVIQGIGQMRTMWWVADPSQTPFGQQPDQQFEKEFNDFLQQMPRNASRESEMEGSHQRSDLFVLRDDIYIQTSKRKNLHSGMREQISLDETKIIPRVATGIAARVDRLKAIGNGQVPRVAATAFKLLAGKF